MDIPRSWAKVTENWCFEINRLGQIRNRETKRLVPNSKFRGKGKFRQVLLPTPGRKFGKPNTRYWVNTLIDLAFNAPDAVEGPVFSVRYEDAQNSR